MLREIAEQSIAQNRVTTRSGVLSVAGGHQFRTFWVRDFCYSVPGLLELGFADSVRDQLLIALKAADSNGLIARGFDVTNPKLRVVLRTFSLPGGPFLNYDRRDLKAEFLGEHGTIAADSNLLLLQAIAQWSAKTGSLFFWQKYASELRRIFDYPLRTQRDGLLGQPEFSDWQDSAKRDGATFYLNLLFVRVLKALQTAGVEWALEVDLAQRIETLWKTFYNSEHGLFQNQPGVNQFSLETQLWAIEGDVFARFLSRQTLWENLNRSPLWGELPGRPIWPFYSPQEISWTTKFVGLRHYHDNFFWSWLMGESLKIARLMNSAREVQKISSALETLAREHHTIHEVYEMKKKLVPVRRALYRSEFPFTWGAAKIVEALSFEVAKFTE